MDHEEPVTHVRSPQRGFTLIELLLVLAIIGILTGIAVPALLGQREKAKAAGTNANVGAIASEIAHQNTFNLPGEKIVSNVLALEAFRFPRAKNPYGGSDSILTAGPQILPGQIKVEYAPGGGQQPDGSPADIIRLTWVTREGGANRTYIRDIPIS